MTFHPMETPDFASVAEVFEWLASSMAFAQKVMDGISQQIAGALGADADGLPSVMPVPPSDFSIWAEWLRMHPDVDSQLFQLSSFALGRNADP